MHIIDIDFVSLFLINTAKRVGCVQFNYLFDRKLYNNNDVVGERESVNRRRTRGKSSGGQYIARSVGERDILHKLINSNCCASVRPLFAMCWFA